MNQEVQDLEKKVHDLQAELQRQVKQNGQDDGVPNLDVIKKEEFEKIKEDIFKQFDILNKKYGDLKKADIEKEDLPSLSKYLLKVKYNDPEVRPNYVKASMTEGSPAQGGYTVPQEWANFVAGELNDVATVQQKCTPFPHGVGFTKNIPKWLTDLTVYWVDEEGVKTSTKPTLTQKQSILKKLCALIPATDEYLQDNSVEMDKLLAKLVAENMAVELERVILVGNTGAGDAFMGIYYSTPATVTQGGASLTHADLVGIWNNPNVLTKYSPGSEWYMNKTTLGLIMLLVDTTGRPLWNQMNAIGSPFGTLFGSPINLSSQIPNTMGTGSVCSTIIYGNYKNVFLGYKAGNEQMSVAISNQAIIHNSGDGTVTMNAFTQDETIFRFVLRRSVVVVNPLAFSVGVDIK